MLVGHNPGLTDFANYLMPNLADNIPTSGVVSMTVETDGWSLAPGSGVELLVFDYPRKDRL
jgi:phosphohistidine phosphatase